MKREHFQLVSEYYNLPSYHAGNSDELWMEEDEGTAVVDSFEVAYHKNSNTYDIKAKYLFIFSHIPTKELADEVLQFIKDTEVLFI